MKTHKASGKQFCKNRVELAKKYFTSLSDFPYEEDIIAQRYAESNLGIISLLSDVQSQIEFTGADQGGYWATVINNIKSILIEDAKKNERGGGE